MISQVNVPKHKKEDGEIVDGGSTVVIFVKSRIWKGNHLVAQLAIFNLLFTQYYLQN